MSTSAQYLVASHKDEEEAARSDPLYTTPVIDSSTAESTPVPHQKVVGHFQGTAIYFHIYLPPKDKWQGRFFHHVYPLQKPEAPESDVGFAVDSGAYFIQTTGSMGFRADMAIAKVSRTIAGEFYGDKSRRIYGYIYGSSGGSFMTIGAIENTQGVWDGAVPIVVAIPAAPIKNQAIRALATLVLRPKARYIEDMARFGVSDELLAELNDLEKAIFTEATKMGIPVRSWEEFEPMADPGQINGLVNMVKHFDPSYVVDYFSKPGYLGFDKSPLGDIIRANVINHSTTISKVTKNADGSSLVIELAAAAPQSRFPSTLDFTLLSADGKSETGAVKGLIDDSGKRFTVSTESTAPSVLESVADGLPVRIDNRWYMSMHSYHRHTILASSRFHLSTLDQFADADGKPLYPQRDIDSSLKSSVLTSGGGTHTGKVNYKTISVCTLVDYDAFSFQADWYVQQVKQSLGPAFHDNFRIWYIDSADHHCGAINPAKEYRLIDFTATYHQALRDLSAWVESDISPPESTQYEISDGQVFVPPTASERRGIQPIVTLTSNGLPRIDATVGENIPLKAHIEVPPNAGKIVSVEWDLNGTATFTSAEFDTTAGTVLDVETVAKYEKAGIYIPNVKVVAQRNGNAQTPYTRINNLGRMVIAVK